MRLETCDNCGRVVEEPNVAYCGHCGAEIKTYVNGGPTRVSSSSTSDQHSFAQANVPSSALLPTQPAITESNKNRLREPRLGIGLVITGVLTIVFVCVIGVAAWQDQAHHFSAEYELETYCNALAGRDYDTAYPQLLSLKTLKSDVSERQFISSVKADADPRGEIGSCTVKDVTEIGTLATGTIVYTYGNNSTSLHLYKLFKNSPSYNWVIDTSYWKDPTHEY